MRVMAVDYGDVRVGVALSDPTGTLTGDAFVIKEAGQNTLAARLAAICAERDVSHVVVGWPRHMNGSVGERAELSEKLAAKIKKLTGLPVTLSDERLTSAYAHRVLTENGKSAGKRKKVIDAVAASIILEGFLDSRK